MGLSLRHLYVGTAPPGSVAARHEGRRQAPPAPHPGRRRAAPAPGLRAFHVKRLAIPGTCGAPDNAVAAHERPPARPPGGAGAGPVSAPEELSAELRESERTDAFPSVRVSRETSRRCPCEKAADARSSHGHAPSAWKPASGQVAGLPANPAHRSFDRRPVPARTIRRPATNERSLGPDRVRACSGGQPGAEDGSGAGPEGRERGDAGGQRETEGRERGDAGGQREAEARSGARRGREPGARTGAGRGPRAGGGGGRG
jgi:hypothetical protein